MEEKDLQNQEEQSVSGKKDVEDGNNYIEAIKEMKKNSVSRDAYEKVQNENKELLNALINGKQIEIPEPKEKPDVSKLRADLFKEENDLSNLEYVKKALELREALIEDGEPDPFLPWGKRIAPDDSDIVKANRVAEALKQCVEYADGNSEIFTNELQRIMVDIPILRQNKFRR